MSKQNTTYNYPWNKRAVTWKKSTANSEKCPTPLSVEELTAKVVELTKRLDYLDGLVEELTEELEAGMDLCICKN